MKTLLTLLTCLIISIAGFAQPTISSFSPLSGPAGSAVTINGSGFSSTAGNNYVFFGNMRAPVTAASATQLLVTVPAGINYSRIAVETSNLTAYSTNYFLLTFFGGSFIPGSFAAPQLSGNAFSPIYADLDNDGLPDLISPMTFTGQSSGYLGIYRNMGSTAQLIYPASPLILQLLNPATSAVTADLTGDGKPDLIVGEGTYIYVYTNTSTPGTISFDPTPLTYNVSSGNPYSIAAADLDGNDKIDLVVGLASSNNLVVISNSTTGGILSFGTKQSYALGISCNNGQVFISDADGDGKPDVTFVSSNCLPILIYRNNSSPGTIALLAKTTITSGRTAFFSTPVPFVLGDFDGDGKTDMALAYPAADSFFIFRNTGTAGAISFAPRAESITTTAPQAMTTGDFDGDGLPDIALIAAGKDTVFMYKNTSVAGVPSFNSVYSYRPFTTSPGIGLLTAADADGDGKTDLLAVNYISSGNGTGQTYFLRNQTAGPVVTSVIPYTASQGQTVTIDGVRFTNCTAVSFGNTPAASFSVVSASVITAIVGSGASGNVTVTTTLGLYKYAGFTFTLPVPAIDSVSPLAGPIGSSTTIYGKNFSVVPAENIVYFGGAKAVVNSSSVSSVTVTVPSGGSYAPVSVTRPDRNLTAWSPLAFDVTFPVSQNAFTNASFGDSVKYSLDDGSTNITAADLDGDGKTDLAVPTANLYERMDLFRNQGASGNVSFAPHSFVKACEGTTNSYGAPLYSVITDMDGDGHPDIVACGATVDTMSVFLNSSVPGTISFGAKKDYSPGLDPARVRCADLDLDGKPDVIVATAGAHTISIFKNISTTGNTQMQPRVDLQRGSSYPTNLLCADLDGDGKPELLVTGITASTFDIYPNLCTPGTISFGNTISVALPNNLGFIQSADFDGDGKPDIVCTSLNGFSIFRNISSPGNISFAPRVDSVLSPYDLTITDINGDGKPDLIFCNGNNNLIYIYPNQSTPGNISFGTRANIVKNVAGQSITTADINGDGKPDLLVYESSLNIYIFKNKFGEPGSLTACPSLVNKSIAANLSGTAYQWQVNTGTGYINLGNGTNYSGANTRTLNLINLPSSNYGTMYRCIVDGTNSDETVLKIENKWKGGSGNAWETAANWSCGTVPDAFTDVTVTTGSAVVNSNVTVRSLTLYNPGAVTVNPGFNLTVTN